MAVIEAAQKRKSLKSVQEISDAYEELYNAVRQEKLDTKRGDTAEKILRGVIRLRVDTPIKLFMLRIQAKRQNLDINVPFLRGVLSEGTTEEGK